MVKIKSPAPTLTDIINATEHAPADRHIRWSAGKGLHVHSPRRASTTDFLTAFRNSAAKGKRLQMRNDGAKAVMAAIDKEFGAGVGEKVFAQMSQAKGGDYDGTVVVGDLGELYDRARNLTNEIGLRDLEVKEALEEAGQRFDAKINTWGEDRLKVVSDRILKEAGNNATPEDYKRTAFITVRAEKMLDDQRLQFGTREFSIASREIAEGIKPLVRGGNSSDDQIDRIFALASAKKKATPERTWKECLGDAGTPPSPTKLVGSPGRGKLNFASPNVMRALLQNAFDDLDMDLDNETFEKIKDPAIQAFARLGDKATMEDAKKLAAEIAAAESRIDEDDLLRAETGEDLTSSFEREEIYKSIFEKETPPSPTGANGKLVARRLNFDESGSDLTSSSEPDAIDRLIDAENFESRSLMNHVSEAFQKETGEELDPLISKDAELPALSALKRLGNEPTTEDFSYLIEVAATTAMVINDLNKESIDDGGATLNRSQSSNIRRAALEIFVASDANLRASYRNKPDLLRESLYNAMDTAMEQGWVFDERFKGILNEAMLKEWTQPGSTS